MDLRAPSEAAAGQIPYSNNIPYSVPSFVDSVKALCPDLATTVVLYGNGEEEAGAKALLGAGYKDVGVLSAGFAGWKEAGLTVCDDVQYIVFDGDNAPAFRCELYDPAAKYAEGYSGTAPSDGAGIFDLCEQRGKVVMLQFTASWCSVCRKEMPHIESEINARFGGRDDFVLIGIDRDEPWEKMEAFRSSTGITYPLAFDPESRIYDLYALHGSGITRNVLIGKDGRIAFRTRLFDPQQFSALVEAIGRELQK